MGIVIAAATMSLDGYIAGPNDAMDWVFEYATGDAFLDEMDEEIIRSTGAVLSGRGGYDVGRRAERSETSGLYGGLWTGPEFVLTHHPPDDEDRPQYTFLCGDITQAVATARAAGGGKNLLVLGANVVQQCLTAGLVDEIHLHVAPVLLSAGTRLFPDGLEYLIRLEPLDVSRPGAFTNLRYRVLKHLDSVVSSPQP
jgi:dihydrofolate reductase